MRWNRSLTLVRRSARFGAAVTALACSMAIATALTAYWQTVPLTPDTLAAVSPPDAGSHGGAPAESPVTSMPAGGEPSGTAEPDPSPAPAAEPERIETSAAITQAPAAATRVVVPSVVTSVTPVTPATPAAPVSPATPTAAPEPAVLASHASVYDAVAAAFPEQPDRAYAVALCESSGYPATNTGNGYYGLWQFDLPTWQSVGGTGLPSQASVEEQVQRARMLYDRRGWSPWGCAP